MAAKSRETSLNVRLSAEESEHLDKLAAQWGVSRSFVIRHLLRSTPATTALVVIPETVQKDERERAQ